MKKQYRIFNEFQRGTVISDISDLDIDKKWNVTIEAYSRDRSNEFNALSHVWYSQISAKTKEDTPAGIKGYSKLHFGIPILRTDTDFSELYDKTIKPLSYETKIEIMSYPDLFNVTSMMKTDQFSQYMDHIQAHYADRVQLYYPDEPR